MPTTSEKREFTSRYLNYCRVNGEADPEKMLEKDAQEEWAIKKVWLPKEKK